MKTLSRSGGFSLLESLMAMVLISIAIMGVISSTSTISMVNDAGARMTQGVFLCEQLHEYMTTLPTLDPEGADTFGLDQGRSSYDSVEDFDGFNSTDVFGAPVDGTLGVLADLSAYTQTVTVQRVCHANFDYVVGDCHWSPYIRVTVTVTYAGEIVCQMPWIRTE